MQQILSIFLMVCVIGFQLSNLNVRAEASAARPAVAEIEYAHYLLKSADQYRDAKQYEQAALLHEEAVKALTRLADKYPMWEYDTSVLRAAYCRRELSILSPDNALPWNTYTPQRSYIQPNPLEFRMREAESAR